MGPWVGEAAAAAIGERRTRESRAAKAKCEFCPGGPVRIGDVTHEMRCPTACARFASVVSRRVKEET